MSVKSLNTHEIENFKINIMSVQPSQLYINEKKLEKVSFDYHTKDNMKRQALPVKKLNDKIILTDGHTRAVLYYLEGHKELTVYWDDPWGSKNLTKSSYEKAVQWCVDEKVLTIKDLSQRIISNRQYEILWLKRCANLES